MGLLPEVSFGVDGSNAAFSSFEAVTSSFSSGGAVTLLLFVFEAVTSYYPLLRGCYHAFSVIEHVTSTFNCRGAVPNFFLNMYLIFRTLWSASCSLPVFPLSLVKLLINKV